ncbi:uncharacterized protein LOC117793214 [Drosophila innubila]|uniref:uncharacterized protein LOC117793214 n=1 Tax=Drosophila innubila TaxID=198719 RepID=UPI00148C071D|nr:uncharacterized protein LOC117793214 [Drosophila innubila]
MDSKFRQKNETCEELKVLQSSVECMRTDLSVLSDAVATQAAYIRRLLKRNSVGLSKLSQRATFPLRSANDLKKLDLKITVDNKRIYINEMKNLLSQSSLSQSIKKIMIEKVRCV